MDIKLLLENQLVILRSLLVLVGYDTPLLKQIEKTEKRIEQWGVDE